VKNYSSKQESLVVPMWESLLYLENQKWQMIFSVADVHDHDCVITVVDCLWSRTA